MCSGYTFLDKQAKVFNLLLLYQFIHIYIQKGEIMS